MCRVGRRGAPPELCGYVLTTYVHTLTHLPGARRQAAHAGARSRAARPRVSRSLTRPARPAVTEAGAVEG